MRGCIAFQNRENRPPRDLRYGRHSSGTLVSVVGLPRCRRCLLARMPQAEQISRHADFGEAMTPPGARWRIRRDPARLSLLRAAVMLTMALLAVVVAGAPADAAGDRTVQGTL